MTSVEVKRIRTQTMKMTVEEFARAVGVSKSSVLRWEQGTHQMNAYNEQRVYSAVRKAKEAA